MQAYHLEADRALRPRRFFVQRNIKVSRMALHRQGLHSGDILRTLSARQLKYGLIATSQSLAPMIDKLCLLALFISAIHGVRVSSRHHQHQHPGPLQLDYAGRCYQEPLPSGLEAAGVETRNVPWDVARGPGGCCSSLVEVRAAIDNIDEELLGILSRRWVFVF